MAAFDGNGDVAQMAGGGGIIERGVVIDKVGQERRNVRRLDKTECVALQTVEVEHPCRRKLPGDVGIGGVAQLLAGRPQKAAARVRVENAADGVVVAERDAAVGVGVLAGEADGVLIGRRLPAGRGRRRRGYQHILQHWRHRRLRNGHQLVIAGRRAALGDDHVAGAVENDF
ncbi:MAG: hypothetical protein WBF58_14330 [Xanthobacteraceae bacterium]